MEHLKNLEALLRNTNVQSLHSSDTKRIAMRSSLTPVLPAIDLGDFIRHPGFPKRPSPSSFDAAQIWLLLEIITGVIWFEDPPLGLPTWHVNICLRAQRWAKEESVTLAWTAWNRGQQQVAQEVERSPRGQSEIKRRSWWIISRPGASAATSITELEWMNNKQRADEKWCIADIFVHLKSFTTEPESVY